MAHDDEGEDLLNKSHYRACGGYRCFRLWPRAAPLAALLDGTGQSLPPGEELLTYFRPFIEHLASSSLSPKTIRRHVDNLWLLGGEIVRDLHYDPSLRKRATEWLLRSVIHEDGR